MPIELVGRHYRADANARRRHGGAGLRMPSIVVLVTCIALTGCQPADRSNDVNDPSDSGADLTLMGESDELLERAVDAARKDLAETLEVSVNGMVVQEASRVTWRDGSLGCPEPGRMYTQAVVPGVLVRLVVDGREYRYHGGQDGRVFHCPSHRVRADTETATR